MQILFDIILIILSLFILTSLMGYAFKTDLDKIERDDPKYRRHLKDKFNL